MEHFIMRWNTITRQWESWTITTPDPEPELKQIAEALEEYGVHATVIQTKSSDNDKATKDG